MTQRIECPSCQRMLLVPEGTEGPWVTCPRCLARVPNPAAVDAAYQAGRPEERPERGGKCPGCGRDVQPLWRTCPWCEEALSGPRGGRGPNVNLDVRRDQQKTSGFVIALAVLGVLGVGWLGFSFLMPAYYGLTNSQPEGFGPLVILTVSLLFLGGLSTLIVFLRSGGHPGASGVRRVVVGTFAMAGGILSVIFLVGLAFFIFFLVVCFSGGFSGPHV